MWFKKNVRQQQKELEERVEIEVSKNNKKQDKKVEEANKVADKLNKIVEENGFTLKIFIAAGGELEGKKNG